MSEGKIPFVGQILFAIGIGVALAVSLDNIAIGAGVGTVFLAGAVAKNKKRTNKPENTDN